MDVWFGEPGPHTIHVVRASNLGRTLVKYYSDIGDRASRQWEQLTRIPMRRPAREHAVSIPLFDRKRPSLRPDLPPGRAPRAAAVKDATANAAAPAKPAQSVLDRASTVLPSAPEDLSSPRFANQSRTGTTMIFDQSFDVRRMPQLMRDVLRIVPLGVVSKKVVHLVRHGPLLERA
jgi:hypothetical protein